MAVVELQVETSIDGNRWWDAAWFRTVHGNLAQAFPPGQGSVLRVRVSYFNDAALHGYIVANTPDRGER
jgi:hypothetical protein